MSADRRRVPRHIWPLAISLLVMVWPLLTTGRDAPAAGLEDKPRDAALSDGDPSPCPIESAPETPLSLARAVDLAFCNNPQIRGAWANIREQAAAVGQARAAWWPSASVTVSEVNDRNGYPGSPVPATARTDKTVYGSVGLHLFDFGGRAATLHSAEALLGAALASRDATIQTVLISVVQAYFDAVTAKGLSDNKNEDEVLARSTLESAQRKLSHGAGAQSDSLQASTAFAKISLDKNRANATYEKALASLVYSLGLSAGTPLSLAADVDARTSSEEQDLAMWLRNAERAHPAIVAARAVVDAARFQVQSARAAGRPTIDLAANYYRNGFPGQGLANATSTVTTIGISITVPLFDGFATRYKVRGAEANVKVKEAELQDIEHATLMQIVKAYSDAQSSFRNLRVSEELLLSAQESLQSSQRRYGNGAADILELLNTQAALSDARGERVRCLAEWRAARLLLMASAGLLNEATVQK